MIDTITQWLNAAIAWADAIPQTFWAVFAGLLCGALLTQWAKRTFPLSDLFPNMKKPVQIMWLRLFAFAFSFGPTYFIWPAEYAVWVALIVGFATPTIYKIVMFFVYKKWPHLEDALSGTVGS